jgi:superfamily II DNA/RNA helicase
LAATGSGKSGAFLIPLVHRLQGLRYTPRGELKPVNKMTPLAIVVAHTKELIQQLYDNAYIFANRLSNNFILEIILTILKRPRLVWPSPEDK